MNRIDVHQHVVPAFWVDGLKQRGSIHRPPAWSAEDAITFMDSRNIAKGILSLTAPALSAWEGVERRELARKVNDYTAGLATRSPDRFGNFATLPLPDLDDALAEISYALDTLAADGVVLMSNYGELFLGDPFFEPLWAELDRREAVVLIHPTRTTLPELEGIPAPFVDFPFATTRSAVQMVIKGVMDRHRKMRVILSHAGGFLPYAAHRFATTAAVMPGAFSEGVMMEAFGRFYFDTALSASTPAIAGLKAFANPERILFGSDFPYAPGRMEEGFTPMLDANPLLSDAEHAAIDHLNAERLWGRPISR